MSPTWLLYSCLPRLIWRLQCALLTNIMAGTKKMIVAVRLAVPKDVPCITAMIRQLADFHYGHSSVASEEDYSSSLFDTPPFRGPTVLLLEISSNGNDTFMQDSTKAKGSEDDHAGFKQMIHTQEVQLDSAISDPDTHFFTSSADNRSSSTIVGQVLLFPNYSSILGKPGIYIEDLYIREPYRKQGFGTMLLRTVAREAAKGGLGRVEWCVMDKNEKAIKFYERMGAKVQTEWKICRLSGHDLEAYGR